MNIEQKGQNDASQNKGMSNDPKWTDAERDKYQAAYNSQKKKNQTKKDD